ncbi:C-type mannose receptor 2-like isoform X1 [Dicentrarchus labrax]|uniref:C-type mannose receptor 2-like isoform X1 n=1 Tax=Dicentrarchus labrax TaxID=13489 RepID=UPI0021F5FD54|nr:C-type mannose receptor 2-like isoform X1 [Dicentrarchus labrax]XP_051280578.1 C-type mannose receptor 2-like isoform X2 [Dicentrarchus labrax]XP_051280579.1 C-type mannose receptor 2-like isoform X1 [Dicentrarchus labrax]
MDIFLLLITAASGLCAVSSTAGRQYHFIYDLKNMTEAQSYCREHYTDLATTDNMDDVNTLNNMADLSQMVYSEYSHRAWIGLYNDVDSWRWSLSDRSFYGLGETEFRKWYPGRPGNVYDRPCTIINTDGLWYDYNCKKQYKSVCMDVRGPNVTFVPNNNLMTWTEAQSYCREHHTDLATVRNMAENQKVSELVPSGQDIWIGLYRDPWKWSDGSTSSFRYWRPMEPNGPNELCVAADFSHSGRWEDWNCDQKRAFICYRQLTTKQVIKLSVLKDSSLDLNDPAVVEQVSKQIKQRLKDQGVNEDIKLSWRKQSDGKIFHKDEKETEKRKKREL